MLREVRELINKIFARVSAGDVMPIDHPPIYNIVRWWDADELSFLCRLKAAIDETATRCTQCKSLLLVGFCRILIMLSNAAFNHQSMSFKERDNSQGLLFSQCPDFLGLFHREMNSVLESAADNPPGKAQILAGDSRSIASLLDRKYDLLITDLRWL